MNIVRSLLSFILLISMSVLITGCFHHERIRHIASDAGLLIPNQTTQKELLSFMGIPDARHAVTSGGEEWIYYQIHESFLRKAPLIGDKMGAAEYDVAILTLQNEIVTSCQYRSLNEEEFQQLGLSNNDRPQ